jgi:SpoVK/Ycf46/Vps4 family AAA+-type ATPase
MDPEILATQTNALKRIDMDNLLLEAKHEKQINVEFLKKKKKELIEKNCYGLLEFLEPSFTLDSVIGHDAAKKRLREDISLLKKGHLDALPVGYLFCGPVGTGKSFLATCTIGEIGIPCVKLLNFRSQWLGVTEGNLERILSTLRALGPVGVIIDEADAFLGDRESSGDSGVSSRVFSQFAIQMGDTRYRGRVIWFLLTCRPDLLPVDIKRQGRIEVHIPMFYPDSETEKIGIITSMCKKEKFDIDANAIPLELISKKSLSGADIEAVVVRAKRLFLLAETPREKEYYVQEALKDFISTTDSEEVKLQELAAVVECTERNFLPARYQEAVRTDIIREYNRLKTLIDFR